MGQRASRHKQYQCSTRTDPIDLVQALPASAVPKSMSHGKSSRTLPHKEAIATAAEVTFSATQAAGRARQHIAQLSSYLDERRAASLQQRTQAQAVVAEVTASATEVAGRARQQSAQFSSYLDERRAACLQQRAQAQAMLAQSAGQSSCSEGVPQLAKAEQRYWSSPSKAESQRESSEFTLDLPSTPTCAKFGKHSLQSCGEEELGFDDGRMSRYGLQNACKL